MLTLITAFSLVLPVTFPFLFKAAEFPLLVSLNGNVAYLAPLGVSRGGRGTLVLF